MLDIAIWNDLVSFRAVLQNAQQHAAPNITEGDRDKDERCQIGLAHLYEHLQMKNETDDEERDPHRVAQLDFHSNILSKLRYLQLIISNFILL